MEDIRNVVRNISKCKIGPIHHIFLPTYFLSCFRKDYALSRVGQGRGLRTLLPYLVGGGREGGRDPESQYWRLDWIVVQLFVCLGPNYPPLGLNVVHR